MKNSNFNPYRIIQDNNLIKQSNNYLQMQESFQASTVANRVKCKLVFLGDMGVGKSSIIQRFWKNKFDQKHNPTVAVDFVGKNIINNSIHYRLQFWDTAGQERFRSLIPAYLKDANCAIIVFDVTNKSSFQNIALWLQMFNDNKPKEAITILIGNKIDLPPKVSRKEAIEKMYQLKMKYYMELSAKSGQGIEKFFDKIIETFRPSENKITQPSSLQSKTEEYLITKKRENKSFVRDCCSI